MLNGALYSLDAAGWMHGIVEKDLQHMCHHSTHSLSHCPLIPRNLIITDWIGLSDYIEALSENTGNEEKLFDASAVECDTAED